MPAHLGSDHAEIARSNIIRYFGRPFASAFEMDEEILARAKRKRQTPGGTFIVGSRIVSTRAHHHCSLHSLDDGGRGDGWVRQLYQLTHGGDLIPVFLHACLERPAVFGTHQGLW